MKYYTFGLKLSSCKTSTKTRYSEAMVKTNITMMMMRRRTMMTKTMMIMTPHNCGVISNAGAFVSLLNVDSPATGSVQSLVLGAENMILKNSFVF